MVVKFGKIRPNNDFSINLNVSDTIENIFAAASNPNQINAKKSTQKSHGNRINDYDSILLENNAFQDLPDELFKLEHKIKILEEGLSKINNEISTLEGLGYDIQIYDLKNRKQIIEQELDNLNIKYSNLGLSSKISNQLSAAASFATKGKNNIFIKINKFLSKKVLTKLSKKFGYKESLKEALESLGNINLNVDELIKMQAPYGETINRYEKLTAYLNKANVIHSQILRNMNTITDLKH